jgi:hypothetical protein
MSLRNALIALSLALTPAGLAARAAPAKVDAETTARYAAAAANERDLARTLRDSDAAVAGDFFRLGPFIKDDLVLLKAATDAQAAIHEAVAVAYEKADVDEIHRLREEQERAYRARVTLRERISEWRNKQFTAAPSEQWFQEYSRWYRTGLPELMAWAEARKAAAEAWGRVADACLPGYDPDALEALKEQAYALDVEREIGEMRFTWARERALVMQNQSEKHPPSSPELTKSIEALTKLQEERLAVKRKEVEREREIRRLDRQIRVADREFRSAYEAAQKDALERARNAAKK